MAKPQPAQAQSPRPSYKRLYLLTKNSDGSKTFWSKVGAGFVNGDGSINVVVDFLPGVSLQLRDPKEDETG